MLKILLIITVGILSAQTNVFNIDDKTITKIKTLKVMHIQPALESNSFTSELEHAVVIKMNTLLDEIIAGRHPQWIANNIINHAEGYVEMNEYRQDKMVKLNKSMERYLRW